jgi:hypothetical protein
VCSPNGPFESTYAAAEACEKSHRRQAGPRVEPKDRYGLHDNKEDDDDDDNDGNDDDGDDDGDGEEEGDDDDDHDDNDDDDDDAGDASEWVTTGDASEWVTTGSKTETPHEADRLLDHPHDNSIQSHLQDTGKSSSTDSRCVGRTAANLPSHLIASRSFFDARTHPLF